MKNRDLASMIRLAAEREIPDVRSKIDLGSIEIIPAPEKRRPFAFSFGKAFSYVALVLVVGVTTLFAYGALVNPTTAPSALPLESTEEIYGFQIVSAAALLETIVPTTPLTFGVALPLEAQTDSPLIDDQLDDITVYLDILETMIGDKTTQSYTAQASDRAGYGYLLVYASEDLLGNPVEYRIYFNQTPDPEDIEKTQIAGLMVLGGTEYALSGTVTEDGETVKTRFTASLDEDNYVEVEDMSTPELQQYAYRLYDNGALSRSHSLKLQMEGEDLQAVIESLDAEHAITFRFQKTLNQENQEIIRVGYAFRSLLDGQELEDGDIDVSVVYDEASQAYRYQYQVAYQHGSQSGQHQGSGSRADKTGYGDDSENGENPGNDHGNDDGGNGSDGGGNGSGSGTGHGNGAPKGGVPASLPEPEPIRV